MTAIQILEKLGADSSMSTADLSHSDKRKLAGLTEKNATFNAALTHAPAEEPEEEPEEEPVEEPEDQPTKG